MSCNHKWSEECYDVVPSQVCVRCNAFQVEEEHAELVRDAFRRGAEAMREAAAKRAWAKICENGRTAILRSDPLSQSVRDAIRALPIPEEP